MIKSLSPDQYRANINTLASKYESAEPSEASSRQLFSELIDAMGGLFGGVQQEKNDRDWWFFRVRRRSSFNDEASVFEAAQHSYPPSKHVKAGRCNLPFQPVFYGSDSFDCAIREMKTPDETNYTLSLWRLPQRHVSYYKFLCGSNIARERLLEHKAGILRDAHKQNGISVDDAINSTRLVAFLEGWSDLFLSSSYAISSAISHTLMYTEYATDCDFVSFGSAIYPKGINFALPTTIADQLELHRVFDIEIDMASGETTWRGCFEPGSTEWRSVKPEDLPLHDPALQGRAKIE